MNAIILAAGVGHRFRNLTLANNKALISVGGVTPIERTICYLHEAGINDITVVTGHMHELFLPLVEKYKVLLIHNHDYAIYNNMHSLELAFHQFGDTFIIHADVVLFKNIFKERSINSYFLTMLKNPKGVPLKHPRINKERVIQEIEIRTEDESATTFLGISYWNEEDATKMKRYFLEHVSDKTKKQFHGEWEDIIPNLLPDIKILAHQLDSKYAMDVNTLKDYFEVCIKYDTHWKKK